MENHKKNWSQHKHKLFVASLLVIFSVIMRIVPHPWNMTPVAAAAIFAGVKLGKRYALIVPFLSMFLGDAIIGFYDPKTLAVVYGSMLLVGISSYLSRAHAGVAMFTLRPILASIFFFLATNAAVCFFTTMYAHSFSGLISSYAAGLPFFGRDLIGNLLYTSLFFGAYEFSRKMSVERARLAMMPSRALR